MESRDAMDVDKNETASDSAAGTREGPPKPSGAPEASGAPGAAGEVAPAAGSSISLKIKTLDSQHLDVSISQDGPTLVCTASVSPNKPWQMVPQCTWCPA